MKEVYRFGNRGLSYDNPSWLEFYPKWCRMNLTYSPWAYFDARPQIHTNVTTLLGIIGIFIIGLSWKLIFLIPLFYFCWGQIFLSLPYDSGKHQCEYPQYGIYNYGYTTIRDVESLWICYGKKSKVLYMPWSLNWYKTTTLLKDGTYYVEDKNTKYPNNKYEYLKENKWKETHPYVYVLNNGTIQNRQATISIETREWRRKWLMFTSLFNMVSKTIAVDFDDEIGERSGSWKGGTIGCGYVMKKNETPLQTLRRMEKERKF